MHPRSWIPSLYYFMGASKHCCFKSHAQHVQAAKPTSSCTLNELVPCPFIKDQLVLHISIQLNFSQTFSIIIQECHLLLKAKVKQIVNLLFIKQVTKKS